MTLLSQLSTIACGNSDSTKLKESQRGFEIYPNPEFSIKTVFEIDASKVKVFINLCSHADVEEPSIKSSIQDDGNKAEGLNIPVSISERREFIHKDKLCYQYAVVVNSIVYDDLKNDTTGTARHFLCQFAIQSIYTKYKVVLSAKYKVLKEVFVGEQSSHYIRSKSQRTPTIEQVSAADKKPPETDINSHKTPDILGKLPGSNLSTVSLVDGSLESFFCSSHDKSDRTAFASTNGKYIEPTQHLERSHDEFHVSCCVECKTSSLFLSQFSVSVSASRVQVRYETTKLLDIFSPYAVTPTTAKCSFSKVDGYVNVFRLVVTATLDLEDDSRPDPGSRLGLIADAFNDPNTTDSPDPLNPLSPSESPDATSCVPQETDTKDVLPEDLFHRKDASSSFLIDQRDQSQSKPKSKLQLMKQSTQDSGSCCDSKPEYIDVDAVRRSLKGQSNLPVDNSESSVSATTQLREESCKKPETMNAITDVPFTESFSNLWSLLLE